MARDHGVEYDISDEQYKTLSHQLDEIEQFNREHGLRPLGIDYHDEIVRSRRHVTPGTDIPLWTWVIATAGGVACWTVIYFVLQIVIRNYM